MAAPAVYHRPTMTRDELRDLSFRWMQARTHQCSDIDPSDSPTVKWTPIETLYRDFIGWSLAQGYVEIERVMEHWPTDKRRRFYGWRMWAHVNYDRFMRFGGMFAPRTNPVLCTNLTLKENQL